MAQSKLYPVVMAGGSGSRLWPLSRVLYPKQFLCLKGDLTMLQTTICRLNGVECESPVVICNEQHRFIVAEQLRQLNKLTENIILEPAGRNTAPAIALAALAAKRHSPENDPLMLVLAADHVIADEDYRPWGKYDSIDTGSRYQVKRLTVKPGESISLQMHHHRAEHWIVVAGAAQVTINEQTKLLGENESIYIPVGSTHCLENPGKIPLELIEIRSGSYLGEDDIVRFADKYGRV
ncbi:sugar phosphate nucleotidyltransferase [Escherichia coli]